VAASCIEFEVRKHKRLSVDLRHLPAFPETQTQLVREVKYVTTDSRRAAAAIMRGAPRDNLNNCIASHNFWRLRFPQHWDTLFGVFLFFIDVNHCFLIGSDEIFKLFAGFWTIFYQSFNITIKHIFIGVIDKIFS
jgi:hypothetical protein